MSEVQRYGTERDVLGAFDDGPYVEYEDYQKLEARMLFCSGSCGRDEKGRAEVRGFLEAFREVVFF